MRKKWDTNNQFQEWEKWYHYRCYRYLKDNMEILSLLCIYNLDDNVNGKFLQRHKLLKFTKERVDLNSSISIKEM